MDSYLKQEERKLKEAENQSKSKYYFEAKIWK